MAKEKVTNEQILTLLEANQIETNARFAKVDTSLDGIHTKLDAAVGGLETEEQERLVLESQVDERFSKVDDHLGISTKA